MVAVPSSNPRRDETLESAGAVVLALTMDATELRVALRLLADGVVGPKRTAAAPRMRGLELLTVREVEVLELLARRRSTADIAAALQVSEATVKTHTRRVFEKLGVHRRDELAGFAGELAAQDRDGLGGARWEARATLPYSRAKSSSRWQDAAVVIDFCQALGTRRWLGRTG